MKQHAPHVLTIITIFLPLIALTACDTSSHTKELMAEAAVYQAQGAYTAAEKLYKELVNEVDEPEPAIALADLYATWQRPSLGLAALETALERGLSPTDVITRQLTFMLLDQQWQPVIQVAETQLDTDPNNVVALQAMVTAKLQQHQCAEARELAKKLWLAHGNEEKAALIYGILFEDASLLCNINSDFCSSTIQCNGFCYDDIGMLLIEQNDWALAGCVFERAVELDPSNAFAHTWLGESLARIDQYPAAESHFLTAVDLHPTDPLGWLLLGGNALQQGDWETARIALLNAHHLDPSNPAPCLTMAELKAAQGLYTEVDTWIKAALERAVNDVDVWKVAARFYLDRNLVQTDMAERIASSAVALSPQDAEAHLLYGWALLLKINTQEALTEIDRAIELKPALGQAHYLRGILMETMGHSEEAAESFIRAADLGYFP